MKVPAGYAGGTVPTRVLYQLELPDDLGQVPVHGKSIHCVIQEDDS